MLKQFVAVMLFLVIASFFITTSINAEEIDAGTLQGLTQEAFVSTNDFENLKLTIERIKSNAESCADSIVDLQLGLSDFSDDERFVREKDLQRIINDYSNISSELISISSVEGPGDRAQTLYALQSDLEALETELNALQTYVQTYLGHLTTGDKKWYFLDSGFLAGTNNSFTANAAISQYVLLVGQTFRTKIDSVITKIKIRLPIGMPLSPDRVFISPYNSTLSTNTFINATSVETNEAPVYTYSFPNFHTYALTPYVFGLRGTSTYPFGAYCCTNEYIDDFGYLCIGNFTRANPTQYAMSLQTQYDLCFDMVFQSDTNMIVSADGIELKNGANIKISGSRVTTISELNTKIAQATQNLRYAISNHVFGTSSIANNAITTDKIASNAITSDKIVSNSVTTVKIEDSAITSDKIANNAVITDKIANGAITGSKIIAGAVTTAKISAGAVNSYKIADSSITTAKISNGAVNSDKLASNSVSANKITVGAISTEKLADNAVSSAKIAGGAITSGKIADNSVTSGKIDTNAVTSEKIADDSITEDKISQDYRNVLITKYGGSITGDFLCAGIAVTNHLSVSEMTISGNGDWLVGNENNPSDIVINNSEGKITAPAGDLTLLASSNGKIVAESFLQMDSLSQSGIVVIPFGEYTSMPVICQGITSDAIILLTPRQDCEVRYWVEIDVNNSSFRVKCNEDANLASSVSFNYFIVKK